MSAYVWRWRRGPASTLKQHGDQRRNMSRRRSITHGWRLNRKHGLLRKKGWNMRRRIYSWRLKTRHASLKRQFFQVTLNFNLLNTHKNMNLNLSKSVTEFFCFSGWCTKWVGCILHHGLPNIHGMWILLQNTDNIYGVKIYPRNDNHNHGTWIFPRNADNIHGMWTFMQDLDNIHGIWILPRNADITTIISTTTRTK